MEMSDAAPSSLPRASAQDAQGESRLDIVFRAAFWCGLLALAFIGGALVVLAGVFPGPQVAEAYRAGHALYDKLNTVQDVFTTDLWQAERRPDRGVTHNTSRAQRGVTLYTSGHAPAAFLIGMNGTVLHEWRKPFSAIWNPQAPEASPKTPQPDEFVYFRKALLYPNGDLLALYEAAGDTPYGYGIVKLDRNSNVLWTYLAAAHHDIDIGPDERIYTLTHEFVSEPPKVGNLETPRLEDFLVILGKDGHEQKKIALGELVANSPWRHLLHTVSTYARADPLHANTVKVIRGREATRFPYAMAGQVLVSFRELGAIAVVDVANEKLVWAARGPWIGQHDPDLLPNGNILLFDNYGNFSDTEGPSRVIEVDPKSMGIVWQYSGTESNPLRSEIRSWQQRLPNGNTLIAESNGGRILQVTRDRDIVWEFINPERRKSPDGRTMIPVIGWAQWIDPNSLDWSLLQVQTH